MKGATFHINASRPAHLQAALRQQVIGLDHQVPLLDGSHTTYVNLDNAASTPPFRTVMEALARFMPYYASVHRGNGFKSRLSTEAYDEAHAIIGQFVGADLENNTVIFVKNTTEAINKLSYRLPQGSRPLVLTTQLEHHSNDLPWRNRGRVIHVRARSDGRLDEDDYDRQLERYGNHIALVTVAGASNVSGWILPIHRLARKAHAVGAKILVDVAQLAPHRPITMKADNDPEHLDFIALSGHKMYAPFGTGALIGPRQVFLHNGPEYVGGGTVHAVTLDEVHWADLPERDEAGSPNVTGAVAMAVAARTLMQIGMDKIAAHEKELTAYTLERLLGIPGIHLYGAQRPSQVEQRVGVIPFNLKGRSHFLVAAMLGYEGGIGVRSGCFCAHPYVAHLLGLSTTEITQWRIRLQSRDRTHMPGMVRISFGCYNTFAEVDRLITMLHRIVRGDQAVRYRQDLHTGEYVPVGYEDPFHDYFSLKSIGRERASFRMAKPGCGDVGFHC